jgi:CDP-4-dehydro-6-deoxyglucose reductase
MSHHLLNNKIPHKNIYLIFGTRTKQDLLYFDEMTRLQKEVANFHYIPTLSREKWDGCCGYVHEIYENLVHEKMNGSSDLPPSHFYLCGWKNMIDEARLRITKLGYDKKSIHLELYG